MAGQCGVTRLSLSHLKRNYYICLTKIRNQTMKFLRETSTTGLGNIIGLRAEDTLESQNKIKVLANLSNLTLLQLEELEGKAKETYPNYKEKV